MAEDHEPYLMSENLALYTAYHELGHALMALYWSLPVDEVSITKTEEGVSGVTCYRIAEREDFTRFATILAGPLAESWVSGKFRVHGSDRSTLEELVRAHGADTLDWHELVEHRIEMLRPDIEKLVPVLMERKRMTGDEIESVLAEKRRPTEDGLQPAADARSGVIGDGGQAAA
jgi:ATP-dependent Zn protease